MTSVPTHHEDPQAINKDQTDLQAEDELFSLKLDVQPSPSGDTAATMGLSEPNQEDQFMEFKLNLFSQDKEPTTIAVGTTQHLIVVISEETGEPGESKETVECKHAKWVVISRQGDRISFLSGDSEVDNQIASYSEIIE